VFVLPVSAEHHAISWQPAALERLSSPKQLDQLALVPSSPVLSERTGSSAERFFHRFRTIVLPKPACWVSKTSALAGASLFCGASRDRLAGEDLACRPFSIVRICKG